MPGADTPVNVSDQLIKPVKQGLDEAKPDLFEAAYQEVLQVLCDNIYSHYLKMEEEARAEEVRVEDKPDGQKKPPSAGGCCEIM